MTNNQPEFTVEENLNPTKEEVTLHTLQVWLHGARKIGIDEIGKPRQLSYVVKNKDGLPIGGLLVKIQMKVLHIESAWVNPEYQKLGIGKMLSQKIFQFANENQCEYMLALSYEFYDALSYLTKNDPLVEIAAQIENCPAPYTLYIFKRKLVPIA